MRPRGGERQDARRRRGGPEIGRGGPGLAGRDAWIRDPEGRPDRRWDEPAETAARAADNPVHGRWARGRAGAGESAETSRRRACARGGEPGRWVRCGMDGATHTGRAVEHSSGCTEGHAGEGRSRGREGGRGVRPGWVPAEAARRLRRRAGHRAGDGVAGSGGDTTKGGKAEWTRRRSGRGSSPSGPSSGSGPGHGAGTRAARR